MGQSQSVVLKRALRRGIVLLGGMSPQRVCCHWLSAMPAQHMKAPNKAQEDTSPAKTDVTSKSPVGEPKFYKDGLAPCPARKTHFGGKNWGQVKQHLVVKSSHSYRCFQK